MTTTKANLTAPKPTSAIPSSSKALMLAKLKQLRPYSHPGQASLTALPTSVHTIILSHILHQPTGIVWRRTNYIGCQNIRTSNEEEGRENRETFRHPIGQAILGVNRAIREESLALLFSEHEFCFRDEEEADEFFELVGEEVREVVKGLRFWDHKVWEELLLY